MEAVSKARLQQICRSPQSTEETKFVLRWLIQHECRELDNWQPIETAPKDRELLLFDQDCIIGGWSYFGDDSTAGHWTDRCGNKINPTAYQELPEAPT